MNDHNSVIPHYDKTDPNRTKLSAVLRANYDTYARSQHQDHSSS